jgi:hypothetical protein
VPRHSMAARATKPNVTEEAMIAMAMTGATMVRVRRPSTAVTRGKEGQKQACSQVRICHPTISIGPTSSKNMLM